MIKYQMVAPCGFGIEGILADELRRMDAENIRAENGRVFFEGDAAMLAAANLRLRTAERVLLVIGAFKATDFNTLFEGVKALHWEDYLASTDAFPVTGYSIDSGLHSIPDCQSIIKKAVVERLKTHYHIDWFKETGPVHKIRFSIQKDRVTLMVDTSGEGLHKRGYRAHSNLAPIKETLAAAMCMLARIYPDTVLYDPFCGSGTILIEAAMMAKNIAPGLRRSFAAERFDKTLQQAFSEQREAALSDILSETQFIAFGSDIDPAAVELTAANAKKCGVGGMIRAEQRDIEAFTMRDGRTLLITNPPYGERLLDLQNAERLYRIMGEKMPCTAGKKYFIISPNDAFERFFGRPADKRRKLYNGMISCQLYMYFKSNGVTNG